MSGATRPALRVSVMSAAAAATYVPSGSAACISVTLANAGSAELPVWRYVAVLRLAFDDVALGDARPSVRPFAQADARRIAEWVEHMERAGVEEIVVHCGFGVSRSPAIALGIADALCLNEARIELEARCPWHHAAIRDAVRGAFRRMRPAPTALPGAS
jgi:predicted protein tyrosine phosphatase